MTSRARLKYWVRSSRVSSGSRPSARVVKPTRSAKSTDTIRRSATGATGAAGAGGGGRGPATDVPAAAPASDVPHSPQNLPVGGFAAPHAGHVTARLVPQAP